MQGDVSTTRARLASLPADRVSLSEVSRPAETVSQVGNAGLRPIFAEASRLGLLVAGATLGGPIGKALSATAQDDLLKLLGELETAGFSFRVAHGADELKPQSGSTVTAARVNAKILDSDGDWAAGRRSSPSCTSWRGEELLVSGHGMQGARVGSLHDLQALEAIGCGKDLSSLARPDLAEVLGRLEGAGVEFSLLRTDSFHGERPVPRVVGAYGALRAFSTTPTQAPDEQAQLRGGLAGTEPVSLQKLEDLDPLRFFVLGESVAGLDQDARARALRDLEQAGYTFHYGWDKDEKAHGAPEIWEKLKKGGDPGLRLGVRGAALLALRPEQVVEPEVGGARLKELSDHYLAAVRPRVASGMLDRAEGDRWIQSLDRALAHLPVDERGRVLAHLFVLESELGSADPVRTDLATRALQAVSDGLRPGEDVATALREYEALRRSIPDAEVGIATMRHVRLELPAKSFDPQDLAEQRERVVRLACLAPSFDLALRAQELIETTLPFDQGASLLESLVSLHRGLGEPSPDPGESTTGPLERAMEDYKLVLRTRAPQEALGEATQTLQTLYHALLPREGWNAARETFAFVERGWARKAFPQADKAATVDTLLQSWVLSQDLAGARAAALNPLVAGGSQVITGEDFVTVGGVKVPRKRQGP